MEFEPVFALDNCILETHAATIECNPKMLSKVHFGRRQIENLTAKNYQEEAA